MNEYIKEPKQYKTNRGIIHNSSCHNKIWYKRADHAWQDGLRLNYKGIYECSKCHTMVITNHMEEV